MIKKFLGVLFVFTLLISSLSAATNFQKVDWTDYLGAKFSFAIKHLGVPDIIYPRRYNQNEREDDIIFVYRGSGVDMRVYIWDQKVYRLYFSNQHHFNVFKGVRPAMTREQIEAVLGPVGKITDQKLHLWKHGNVKLIVDFDKEGKAKEILMSLDEN